MTKKYNSDFELQQKLLNGAKILTKNVASTLGPRGRNVILAAKGRRPIITKDGVTVAKFVDLKEHFENIGAQIIKQAAAKTNVEAGDGTTTSTILAYAILKQAQKYLTSGVPPVELKKGIDKAVIAIVEKLGEIALPISSEKDIAHIATISANGDETIGKLIAMAVDLAGKDGAITIEEAKSVETSLDIVEGFRFSSGYMSNMFITEEKRGVVRYDDPLILVTSEKIDNVNELMPVLELIAREARPCVIVAEEIEGQALAALIMNATRGTLRIAAVKAPFYGEERRNLLKDLACSMGATMIGRSNDIKLKDIKLSHFGSATTFECSKSITTVVGGKGNNKDIEKQIESLKIEIQQTESLHACEKIQERITRLASGIAIIHVGAATEIEMIEKKHRIEDALEAVKSAQQEGIVVGGGLALIRAAQSISVKTNNENEKIGVEIVLEAIKEPIRQMSLNAGESPDLILQKILTSKNNKGWDFARQELVDMFKAGIVDPAKVTRCALQNAASVASTLLTTSNAIIEI